MSAKAKRERMLTELGLMLKTGTSKEDPAELLEQVDAEIKLHIHSKRGRKERREDEKLWRRRLDVWLDIRGEVMRELGHKFAEIDWEALGIKVDPVLESLEAAAAAMEGPDD